MTDESTGVSRRVLFNYSNHVGHIPLFSFSIKTTIEMRLLLRPEFTDKNCKRLRKILRSAFSFYLSFFLFVCWLQVLKLRIDSHGKRKRERTTHMRIMEPLARPHNNNKRGSKTPRKKKGFQKDNNSFRLRRRRKKCFLSLFLSLSILKNIMERTNLEVGLAATISSTLSCHIYFLVHPVLLLCFGGCFSS